MQPCCPRDVIRLQIAIGHDSYSDISIYAVYSERRQRHYGESVPSMEGRIAAAGIYLHPPLKNMSI